MKNPGRARVKETILLKFSYSGTPLLFSYCQGEICSGVQNLGFVLKDLAKKGRGQKKGLGQNCCENGPGLKAWMTKDEGKELCSIPQANRPVKIMTFVLHWEQVKIRFPLLPVYGQLKVLYKSVSKLSTHH